MSDGAALFVLLAILLVYFLPSLVAIGRERNGGVIIVNLFLGWTLLGWVIALAWAASLPRRPPNAEVAGSTSAESVLCPFCAEKIKAAAIVCKHCGRDIPN